MKKRNYKRFFALLLAVMMIFSLTACNSPQAQYEKADSLLAKGEYAKAAEAFDALGSYSDASRMALYCRAFIAGEEGEFQKAATAFSLLSDIKDSALLADYYTARSLEEQGGAETDVEKWYQAEGWVPYYDAYELYTKLSLFRDSDIRAEACRSTVYNQATALADAGKYNEAAILMGTMGSYNDAEKRSLYYSACYCEQQQDYTGAYSLFASLETYEDAATRAQAILAAEYAQGEGELEAGKYEDAYATFTWLDQNAAYAHQNGNASVRAQESAYLRGEQLLTQPEPAFAQAREWFALCGEYAPENKASATERIKESWYLQGESFLYGPEPDFVSAAAALEQAGDYPGASTRINAYWYQLGIERMYADTPDFEGARAAFETADGFAPEGEPTPDVRIMESWYLQGLLFGENNDYVNAMLLLHKNPNFRDTPENIEHLRSKFPGAVDAGISHLVALRSDGTVITKGLNDFGKCLTEKWKDILFIAAGHFHTVGLKTDGTVIATGSNKFGQCNVQGWSEIIELSAGKYHTVALRSDGTVVAAGMNTYGQCDVGSWTDIVQISAGENHTVGLRADGTVVAVGLNTDGQCDVDGWTDVVAISAGLKHTVALKTDGTAMAVGRNAYGQCNVNDFKNLIAIDAGNAHTVGLTADGTVVATGDNLYDQLAVDDWTDIVAVSAGGWYTIGLKPDGTLVAVGNNYYLQCEITDWQLNVN